MYTFPRTPNLSLQTDTSQPQPVNMTADTLVPSFTQHALAVQPPPLWYDSTHPSSTQHALAVQTRDP